MPRNSYSLSRYPRYPDNWDEIRRAVYERDNHTCANYPNCPDTPDAKILQAHHIIPLSLGGTNNMSNLKTVCRACHTKLHPHMQSSYPEAWGDDEDDDDDDDFYDIDILPTHGGYHTVRPYNATYSASSTTKRKSSHDAKWGWIIAAVVVVLGWMYLRYTSEDNSRLSSIVVSTVGMLPPVYSGPSTDCEVLGQLASASDAVITGWVSWREGTWFRLDESGWISASNISPRYRDEARRTRGYPNAPPCWEDIGTPTPKATPTAMSVPTSPSPSQENQRVNPRDSFPRSSSR